jgi:gas vesicle protein
MNNDGGLNVIYFLAGLALGVLGGILFAPRAGEEIREDVRRRTNEKWEYLNEQADKIRDATEKMVERSKEWMDRQSDSWRSGNENPGQEPKATI